MDQTIHPEPERHEALPGTLARDAAIAEITKRLIAACQPVRIYLFGSVARGDDGPDSDLDFLVVVPDDAPDEIFRGSVLRLARRGISYCRGCDSVAADRF